MKRAFAVLVVAALLLCGCTSGEGQMDRALNLRSLLLAKGARFSVALSADYGNAVQEFSMDCEVSSQGAVSFTVMKPESIAGISGTVDGSGGKLTFDSTVLSFELMADGQLSPVSAPWVLMKTLRSGYLSSSVQEADHLRLAIDDSYENDALHLDIWLDVNDAPVHAEIIWQGRRLMSMDVKDFTFL